MRDRGFGRLAARNRPTGVLIPRASDTLPSRVRGRETAHESQSWGTRGESGIRPTDRQKQAGRQTDGERTPRKRHSQPELVRERERERERKRDGERARKSDTEIARKRDNNEGEAEWEKQRLELGPAWRSLALLGPTRTRAVLDPAWPPLPPVSPPTPLPPPPPPLAAERKRLVNEAHAHTLARTRNVRVPSTATPSSCTTTPRTVLLILLSFLSAGLQHNAPRRAA